MNYWIDHCAPPRDRAAGFEWDVFISYRSADRVWAMALYDMLTQCGYTVFLDQYVLVAGKGLASQLAANLRKSASGVLIWSTRTADSKWVEREYDSMTSRQLNSADSDFPFFFVVASLDKQELPALADGTLYIDFSEYPDGPMGADLVKLTFGLQGKAPDPSSVARLIAYEQSIKQEPARLRAMAKSELYEKITERIAGDDPAYTTSATLSGVGIDLLIRGKQYPAAIAAVEEARKRFPASVRLRQLHGLALRRGKQLNDAAFELNLLVEEGHTDPETLGMLGAVWADIWEMRVEAGDADGARDALERSRNLYRDAFSQVPTDTYTGINAASKSALLGELDDARSLAGKVLERLTEMEEERGGGPPSDYWERVTKPEAHLVNGDWEEAAELYHEARVAHQNETGSIESTATQLRRLLGVLDVPDGPRQRLVDEFKL